MARVFLHVGTMKSGTTYLQSACNANRKRLARAGLTWPGSHRTNTAVQDLLGSRRLPPGMQGAWSQFATEVGASDEDVLISMELLAAAGPRVIQRLARTLAPHDLQMILTVRDITQVVPSHWQETTQNRGELSWEDYCSDITAPISDDEERKTGFWRHHDVPRVLESWSAVVPLQNTVIVTVPRSRRDPDILWSRFLSVMGVTLDDTLPHAFSNESLGAVSAELMRRVNSAVKELDWQQYRWGFKSALAKRTLSQRAEREPRYTLRPEHHLLLRDRALAMVQRIQELGVRVVGDLDEIVPTSQPPRHADFAPHQLTDSMLLEAAVAGLAGIGEVLGDLRLERDQLLRGVEERDKQLEETRARLSELERAADRFAFLRRMLHKARGPHRVGQ